MPRLAKPAPLPASIGAVIRSLRLQHGMTLESLSYDCDVSKGHLSDIEHGRVWARLDTLMKIAFRFGLPVAELIAVPEGSPKAAEKNAHYEPAPRKKRGRPTRT